MMEITETPPQQLSEGQLFDEYMELVNRSFESGDGYEEATIQKRKAVLLEEVSKRLETLEAMKSLIDTESL